MPNRATRPCLAMPIINVCVLNAAVADCLTAGGWGSGGQQMFDACLGDADAGIRVAALKACCSFLQDLDGGVCTSLKKNLNVSKPSN